MDIVVMNLECAFLPVCYFPCLRAEDRFPVPHSFFSHFLTGGLSEMELDFLWIPYIYSIIGVFKS